MTRPTYDQFVKVEAAEVERAYEHHTGHPPAISDMFHNSWRRLVEGWTHANILHDIAGEPLDPVIPEPAPTPPVPPPPQIPPIGEPTVERIPGVALVIHAKDVLQARHANLVLEGAVQITNLVAWWLRDQGAGILSKPGGSHCELPKGSGQFYATDIVVFSDGTVFDCLVDGGGLNGCQWTPLQVDAALRDRMRSPVNPNATGY